MKPSVSVLVTDLDNTLFDWFNIWFSSFSAMLDCVVRISGIPVETLLPEIKAVHEKHGTSEYAFVLEELPSLQAKYPGQDLSVIYKPAIDAYRAARRGALSLYPTVEDTLKKIKANGCQIVGYTESMAFYSNYRLRHLELDLLLDVLYSPPDHKLPKGLTAAQIRKYPASTYSLRNTVHKHTPIGEVKPNAAILLQIVADVNVDKRHVVYVGDSKPKDVAMAQQAGVMDVWAKYGEAHKLPEYDLLVKVTHWPQRAVENEKKPDVEPTYVLESSFSELLDKFVFGAK